MLKTVLSSEYDVWLTYFLLLLSQLMQLITMVSTPINSFSSLMFIATSSDYWKLVIALIESYEFFALKTTKTIGSILGEIQKIFHLDKFKWPWQCDMNISIWKYEIQKSWWGIRSIIWLNILANFTSYLDEQ